MFLSYVKYFASILKIELIEIQLIEIQ